MAGKKKTIKKIIKIAILVVIVSLIVVGITVTLLNKRHNKTTFVFSHSLMWVETGSMEPTIPEKSYILVKKSNGKNLSVGTIITFVCTDSSSSAYGKMITHRIIEVTTSGYKTKGDNSNPDTWTVKETDIVATHVKNLKVTTFFGRLFASPIGLIFTVGLFVASCAFIYIPDIIDALKDENKIKLAKEKEIARRIEEEIKKLQEHDEEK